MILVTSDWHLNPGELFPKDFFSPMGEEDVVIFNGDMLNILPLGMKQWRTEAGNQTVQSLYDALPMGRIGFFMMGNHEGRLQWMRELFQRAGILCERAVDIGAWHFEHGHKLTEWRWLGKIADDITEAMVAMAPGLWYKFCSRMKWIPSKYANPGLEYQDIVVAYWAMAMVHAKKLNKQMVIGHSHTRGDILTQYCTVIDCGARQVIRLV